MSNENAILNRTANDSLSASQEAIGRSLREEYTAELTQELPHRLADLLTELRCRDE